MSERRADGEFGVHGAAEAAVARENRRRGMCSREADAAVKRRLERSLCVETAKLRLAVMAGEVCARGAGGIVPWVGLGKCWS
jgi:hypothetical protein